MTRDKRLHRAENLGLTGEHKSGKVEAQKIGRPSRLARAKEGQYSYSTPRPASAL
jgi:hypothetical protein